MHRAHLILGRLVFLLPLASCAEAPPVAEDFRMREVTPPWLAPLDAHAPVLAADPHGRVAFTFVTSADGANDLWLALSADSGVTFSEPVRVNPRPGGVLASSDNRPAAAFGPAGAFAVAWNESDATGRASTHVVVRASGDGGHTLGPPTVVDQDSRSAASMPGLAFRPDGALFVAWIERGDPARADRAGGLGYAISMDGGRGWSDRQRLEDVCSCCPPAVLGDPFGRVAVAYRSLKDGLRDPAIAVSDDGSDFVIDEVVSPDGWHTQDCSGVGGAITWNREDGGHYAWFTGAGERGVYLAPWSAERGAMGLRRAVGDSLVQAIRPRLAVWNGSTLIAVEATPRAGSPRTVFAVRTLDPAGKFTPWTFLGGNVEDPWLAAAGERAALACWIERDREHRSMRLVRLSPARP